MTRKTPATSGCGTANSPSGAAGYASDFLDRAADVVSAIQVDPARLRYVRDLPQILTEWYSDPHYIGANSEPVTLVLDARGPSLRKLIRRVLPDEDPEEVAATLVAAGAIRCEDGRYTPLGRYVSFVGTPDDAHVLSVASIRGHLCTIQHNLSCSDPHKRMLDRSAWNQHIPIRALRGVHRYVKRRAGALIDDVDAYLQDQAVPPGSEPTTCVGLSAVAWEDPWITHADSQADAKAAISRQGSQVHAPLEPTVRRAIRLFVRIAARFGVSFTAFSSAAREEYLEFARESSRGVAPGKRAKASSPKNDPEIKCASDIIGRWYDDAHYTDDEGNPLALPRRGHAPSLETLIRSVDPRLSPNRAVRYLKRARAIRRVGSHYLPVKNVVILRGMAGPAVARNVRGITDMLTTAEHNLMPEEEAPGWLERTVENATVPVSSLDQWSSFLDREAQGFLERSNAFLRELELQRDPGERTVRAGAGIYRIQDEVSDCRAPATSAGRGDSPSRPRTAR